MAKNPKFSDAAVNAKADALCTLLNNGYLRIYTMPQPENADADIGSVTLLAELRFGATAFDPAVAGVAAAQALTGDSAANDTGTAAWFRALKSDGVTAVFDGSIGAADADLVLNAVAIVADAAVSVSSFSYSEAKG